MSSHHIVREKQEPALLIINLDSFNTEYLGQLLEWSPTVIVNEAIYAEAESLGIKIDAIITSNPSFVAQHYAKLIETENSPLEDGLRYLVGEQYNAVNVITNEFVLKDFALFAELINLVVFTPGKKIYSVKSGFSKWQVGGQELELLNEASDLTVSGLEFINEAKLRTQKDGFYSICFHQPFLFIAEEL